MKKYVFLFLLFVAGCYSTTFIPYVEEGFPAHKNAKFVKDTTQINFYYFYLGEYYLDANTIFASRNDLLEEILKEANYRGADLITSIEFDSEKHIRTDKTLGVYTSETNKSKCLFIRYLRDETGELIKRK